MKKLIFILFSQICFSQFHNYGEIQMKNIAFHTELINDGSINGSELLRSVKGEYFQVDEITKEHVIFSGGLIKATLNGSPVVGEQKGEFKELLNSDNTGWINANDWNRIKIGSYIVETKVFDMSGRYIGKELIHGQSKGIYIIYSLMSDGKYKTKKVKL